MSKKTKKTGSSGSAGSNKNKHELALRNPVEHGSQEVGSQEIVETDSKLHEEEDPTVGKKQFLSNFFF